MRLFITAAVCAAFSLPAAARQASCGPHAEVAGALAERWGERSAGMGIMANGVLMELMTNAQTGPFTVVLTQPGGAACVILAGDNWQGWPPPDGDRGGPGMILREAP